MGDALLLPPAAPALLDTSMRTQPLGTHWEAVQGCVSTLGYLKATPRLVYIVSQMAQFLSRLPGKPGKVAASVLARWARSDAAGVSSAIAHLLQLRPLGPDENPDVSCVILLLGLWLDVAQSAPPEVVSALVTLMEDDSKPMVALRQELVRLSLRRKPSHRFAMHCLNAQCARH